MKPPRESALSDSGDKVDIFVMSDQKFRSLYHNVRTVGRGSFAKVKEIEHRETGERFAAKMFDKGSDGRVFLDQVVREFALLSKMRHENIVRLYAAYETPRWFFMVTELCTGGQLMSRLVRGGKQAYSEDTVRRHAVTITQAVGYMHSLNIAHRDLKPENVLLSDDTDQAVTKIADLGLSRIFENELMETVCGTHIYLAPELVKCDRGILRGYGPSIDMWGIGIITYIMLFGANPFDMEKKEATHDAILFRDVPFPARTNVSEPAVHFIKQLLLHSPRKRMTAAEALRSGWLTSSSSTVEELMVAHSAGPDDAPSLPVRQQLWEWHAGRMLSKVFRSRRPKLLPVSVPFPGADSLKQMDIECPEEAPLHADPLCQSVRKGAGQPRRRSR